MPRTIDIDPISRIEGHLAFRIETESDRIVQAYSSGEMFRGFEAILEGRDPLDAQQITQRICGVCPVSHGIASVLAQEAAYDLTPPENGRLARNIILSANYIQSHILHFYLLSALDFIDIAAITQYGGRDASLVKLKSWIQSQMSSDILYPGSPFLPRYDAGYVENSEFNILAIKHYLEALEIRALAHQLGAVFAGKLPHATAIVPGGVTQTVTDKNIAVCASMIEKLRDFIASAYLPDVVAVAQSFPDYFEIGKGCGNFLAYGVFQESGDPSNTFLPSGVVEQGALKTFDESVIYEDVRYSFFSSPSGLKPTSGQTVPEPGKSGAYSWIKAPRYQGNVMEVGPLARITVGCRNGRNQDVNHAVDGLLSGLGKTPEQLNSVMGRHAARAIECKIIADRCADWIGRLTPGQPVFEDFEIPRTGRGYGLTEAPRGALGHWLEIENYKIKHYQCVVPTTWNCSPRDDNGKPGPVEQALVGTFIANQKNPIEATRVIRSFDPCIACAVH